MRQSGKNRTDIKRRKNSKPNSQSKNQRQRKNISLPAVIQKVIDVVSKPIKTLSQRHAKKDEVDVPFAESRSSGELTTSLKFFYSNDRFIETFDDKDLYDKICNRWPALHEDYKLLQHKRSAILDMLSNEDFMKELNDQYGMNAFDVVSFLFRLCPSLFKGIFVKKVQNVVKNTQYAKKLKKHKYKIAKPAKGVSKRRGSGF